MAETFGSWLERQIKRREWNQTEFAQKAGVSHGRVSDWVRNVRMPSSDSCDKIADALNISLDEVLQRAGHRHEHVDNPQQAALVEMLRKVDLTAQGGQNERLLRVMMEEMIGYSALPEERK